MQALYPCMRNVFGYMKRRRGGATICCTIVTWLCFFNKFVIIIHNQLCIYVMPCISIHFMVTNTQKKHLSVDLTLKQPMTPFGIVSFWPRVISWRNLAICFEDRFCVTRKCATEEGRWVHRFGWQCMAAVAAMPSMEIRARIFTVNASSVQKLH